MLPMSIHSPRRQQQQQQQKRAGAAADRYTSSYSPTSPSSFSTKSSIGGHGDRSGSSGGGSGAGLCLSNRTLAALIFYSIAVLAYVQTSIMNKSYITMPTTPTTRTRTTAPASAAGATADDREAAAAPALFPVVVQHEHPPRGFGSVRSSSRPENVTNSTLHHHLTFYVANDTQTRHHLHHNHRKKKPILAICAATRSKPDWTAAAQSPLQHLIRSIAGSVTASEVEHWDIRLLVAIDEDDGFWLDLENTSDDDYRRKNDDTTSSGGALHYAHNQLAELEIPSWLTLIVGSYPRIPNHIPFNEIAAAAYQMNAEYYCRVNDDSDFSSHSTGWISRAVHVLQQEFDPPNVGVVGPSCHEGNTKILTHDLVHRTHLEIFQQEYYPQQFHNWYLDDWITLVYHLDVIGVDRSLKLPPKYWLVRHWISAPRYTPNTQDEALLPAALAKGRLQILHYLQQHFPNHTTTARVAAKAAQAKAKAAAAAAVVSPSPPHLHTLYPVMIQTSSRNSSSNLPSLVVSNSSTSEGDNHANTTTTSSSITHSLQFYVANQSHYHYHHHHTNSTMNHHRHHNNKPILAICAATRSKPDWTTAAKSPLQHLIRSIAETVTASEVQHWDIRLLVAIDVDDGFWWNLENENDDYRRKNDDRTSSSSVSSFPHNQLAKLQVPAWLTLIVGSYPRIPNHIPFNEIAAAAYQMNAEYYCRVNDDSDFSHTTTGWISRAVHVLQKEFDPPNVGVVGPSCHEGKTDIMTHDMVHRTHLEIFQQEYYPQQFHNWYLDDWITLVYQRDVIGVDRSRKLPPEDWLVRHWISAPRYEPNTQDEALLPAALAKGREQIWHYLQQHFPNHTTTRIVAAAKAKAAAAAAQ